MSEGERCPQCGSRLTESAEGLCPRCLLIAAFHQPAGLRENGSEPDRWIGPYRIVRLLGEGGMGMVYLAEQKEPIARQVALKIIKLGMDTRAVLARFQSEQQALALMDHPNIAQVHDAGSSEQGRPYFVMEYVPGVPITDYCDQHRLNTRQRLDLFLQVASGVQHAHQKGVIHRDLKPSNILVIELDGEAVPKIIDFGLAKATEKSAAEETLFTQAGLLIGTPEYMSPEQAQSAVTIDSRTDIYSLGVLLYELLVGAAPFDSRQLRIAGYDEIRRIIREDDPPVPAARLDSLADRAQEVASRRATDTRRLRREVSGELEWILLKALEKDPSRRYGSVSGLAEDVRRRLAGEAVDAAPPSLMYGLRKCATRHWKEIPLAIAVLLALMLAHVLGVEYRRSSEIDQARADRQRYSKNLANAQEFLSSGQYAKAKDFLSYGSPAQRSWEWRYLRARVDDGLQSRPAQARDLFSRFDQPVSVWAAAPRANAIALGSQAGTVMIVTSHGKVAQHWQLYESAPKSLALSSDARQLAVLRADGVVEIWDVASRQPVANLNGQEPALSLSFSPDGRTLATGSADGSLFFWDTRTYRVSRRIPRNLYVRPYAEGQRFESVMFAPSGKAVCRVDNRGSQLLDWGYRPMDFFVTLTNFKAISFRALMHIQSFPEPVLALGEDGSYVLTARLGNEEASIRSVSTLASVVLKTAANVNAAVFNPRGDRVAIGTQDGGVQIWNVPHGERLLSLRSEPNVRALLFSADDGLVAIYDTGLQRWDAQVLSSDPGDFEQFRSRAAQRILAVLVYLAALCLIAGFLWAVFFRLPQLQSVVEGLFSWRAARVCRWVALIVGSFLALITALVEFPAPQGFFTALLLICVWLGTGGLVLAWVWETLGGVLALLGFSVWMGYATVMAKDAFDFAMIALLISGCILHVLCGLRLRAGSPGFSQTQSARTKVLGRVRS